MTETQVPGQLPLWTNRTRRIVLDPGSDQEQVFQLWDGDSFDAKDPDGRVIVLIEAVTEVDCE